MDNIAVRCSKECFQDGTGVVVSSMEAMTAGNLLVGGIIGLGRGCGQRRHDQI
jgi:hypothetical protein